MLDPLADDTAAMLDDVITRRSFIVDPLHRFLSSGLSFNFTKTALYEYFRSANDNVTLDAADVANTKLVAWWQQYIGKLGDLETAMNVVYRSAFELDVWPINRTVTERLWVVQYGRQLVADAASPTGNKTELARFLDMLADNVTQLNIPMISVVSILYNDYLAAIEDVRVTHQFYLV